MLAHEVLRRSDFFLFFFILISRARLAVLFVFSANAARVKMAGANTAGARLVAVP